MTFDDTVRRVPTGTGTRPEPRLDPKWDDLTQLQWKAALTTAESGITVTVRESQSWTRTFGVWRRDRGEYDVQTEHTCTGIGGFTKTWAYLNGIVSGAFEANWNDQ